jgi:hypothetical protein
LVALAFALAAPASALAETRYVAKTGSDTTACTHPASPCATISYAVAQAQGGDTIQIGPGNYTEWVQADKVLTFVGAGAGTVDGTPAATLVHPPVKSGYGYPAFELPRGGTLRSLRAEGGDSNSSPGGFGDGGGNGVDFHSMFAEPASLRLENVVAVGGNGAPGALSQGSGGEGAQILSGPGPVSVSIVESELAGGQGFLAEGLSIRGDSASGEMLRSRVANGDIAGSGIHVGSDAELTLTEVDVVSEEDAAILYDGRLTVRRSRLRSEAYRALIVSGGPEESPEAELIDSLVASVGFPAATVDVEEGGAGSLKVLDSTLVARGGEGGLVANREDYGGPASVTLRNSIVRLLDPAEAAVDLLAFKGGSIDAAFSSFSSVEAKEGAAVTSPGSGSNFAGPPGFIDEGNGVYVLQNSSPLIDRGDPSIVAAGQLDLLGNPRSLDGNRDCLAAPDIGAYEVTGQDVPCDPPPTISRFGMTNRVFAPAGGRARTSARKRKVKRGTRFTYALSEPASVAIAISRKSRGRRVKRAGKARCVKPTPKKTKPRCVRFTKVTTLTGDERAGRQATPFSGRVRGKALKTGRYRATIVATDGAGQKSLPRRISFRVVRG